ATGEHMSPIPYADVVTTTTHKTLRGPRGGMILCPEKYESQINRAVFPGIQGGPLMQVIAAKAVALKEALQPEFRAYQRQVVKNARTLANALQRKGYNLVGGGTDTHLILVDLRDKNITGKEAEDVLDQVGATVNKNAIPFDPLPPAKASGIRIGTPAVTTRGMAEQDMEILAEIIHLALHHRNDPQRLAQARQMVEELCRQYPLY
ncbi:MAG TPA: serine hydroxymethyltransferase, partial [Desulfotomaculum sp.]|nr:serine hydroxymethyltransferase [Desulfotomaculum sp.]